MFEIESWKDLFIKTGKWFAFVTIFLGLINIGAINMAGFWVLCGVVYIGWDNVSL
jgi:hypothetical protein